MMSWSSLKGAAQSLAEGLLDLVYPPKCLICGAFQPRYICPRCIDKINILGPYLCRRCGAPIDKSFCIECKGRELFFDSTRCVAVYDGVLREAIHLLKYSGQACLVSDLAELMISSYKSPIYPDMTKRIDVVVSVPTDKSRQLERGFNHSQLLAERLASAIGKPLLDHVLLRVSKAPPQSRLSYDERLLNLIGAFGVSSGVLIDGMSVLLVDDVYTTGSTANEAAKTLKEAGAREVHVFTLARSLPLQEAFSFGTL